MITVPCCVCHISCARTESNVLPLLPSLCICYCSVSKDNRLDKRGGIKGGVGLGASGSRDGDNSNN